MKIIKYFLIVVLVLTCIGGGTYYVMLHTKGDTFPTQLASLQTIQPFIQDGITQASQNLPDISQIGSVLGAKDEIRKGGPAAPQQAFEKARYSYCQQVVKDYERRYSVASESGSVNR
jgi:hypothetical protein